MKNIDFIGDIHGYSDKLEELMLKLEYRPYRKGFRHSSRMTLFVGDYIDRGPNNPRTVEIVRSMVDSGDAIALCGNHEHNAICYNTLTDEGYLRKRNEKNTHQHSATLQQYQFNKEGYSEAISWFKTLPLYYETDHFRAVHASWDQESIELLISETSKGVLSDSQYLQLVNQDSNIFNAVEVTCKGKESLLPNGRTFKDKDGHERNHIRIKWWLDATIHSADDISILSDMDLGNEPLQSEASYFYNESEKPIFFGHYWLKGEPQLYRNNICCLDYSVAKGGYLCCYRYNGEKNLDESNLVFV